MYGVTLKPFQERAVVELLNNVDHPNALQKIVFKAPTGSGKTIILLAFLEKFLRHHRDYVVCWFCPGKGELEEQSRDKLKKFTRLSHGGLEDILNNGFAPQTSYFINWETLNSKNNIATREGEKDNIFDRIRQARIRQLKFLVIVDEEHQNNTFKSQDILKELHAMYEIRVSATPVKQGGFSYVEVPETDVIEEGLITRYLIINDGLDETVESYGIQHETDYLLERADQVRKQIAQAYLDLGEGVRPLVLIQFPSLDEDRIRYVEDKLGRMGYTYQNGMLASWFSGTTTAEKRKEVVKNGKRNIGDNPSNSITRNNASPVFLLFKQAIATGWDCPRAKILVKLRENMTETFEIQTLGRLRRMPKARHYDNEILDCAYLFTFDEKYKQAVIEAGKAYQIKTYTLKDEAKSIKLPQEAHERSGTIDQKQLYLQLRKYFIDTYKLSKDKANNLTLMAEAGYLFTTRLQRSFIKGKYEQTDEVGKNAEYSQIFVEVNTHAHGIDLQRCIHDIGGVVGINYQLCAAVLRSLFLDKYGDKGIKTNKLLKLSKKQFYAFIINNFRKIKDLFIEFSVNHQKDIEVRAEVYEEFTIPLQDHLKYVPEVVAERVVSIENNVYHGYDSSLLNEILRSKAEISFEYYCESRKQVKFVYKNGDVGSKYFSITYQTGIKDRQFYPDYIVQLHDGSLWIIETKGGEISGHTQNIDLQSQHKFAALQRYAAKHKVNFAFVRFKGGRAYYNNSIYCEEMDSPYWQPLEDLF